MTERAACTIQVPDDPPCARPDVLCPACNYENDCAQTAPPITCTCVNYTCENDACSRGSSSCDQGCDRVTDGLSCLSGGAFGVCQSGVCIVPVNIDSNEASGPLCRTEPSAAR